MSDQAPDLWERFRAWVFGRFGVPGLIILACVSAALFAWTQWDKVSNWLGVRPIVELVSREPVPKADPERFSVLVAKLNGDATDTLGNRIFEVLKEFSGVQALPLDRTLASHGRMTEAMEAEAGEAARRYLQRSGASVLIWGSVLDPEHKIARRRAGSISRKSARRSVSPTFSGPTSLRSSAWCSPPATPSSAPRKGTMLPTGCPLI